MQGRGVCAIDLDALSSNLREVQRIVGPRVRTCAVVKADAYGHGAVPVSRRLLAEGVQMLAVASLHEARELRRGDIAAPILVLGSVAPAEASVAVDLGLSVVAWDARAIAELAAAVPAGRRLRVHLKVDTGLGRIGAIPRDLDPVCDALRSGSLELEGVMSHLASGEVPGDPSIDRQLSEFERVLAAMADRGLRPSLRHVANSGGLLSDPRTHLDMVRPGLVLYGALPSPDLADRIGLRPVMQLRATVLQRKDLPPGHGVGYGSTHRMADHGHVAVLHLGYAQGVPRALSNRGVAILRGKPAPIVGLVSMDHTTIDVTGIPDARVGDEAILWGSDVKGNDVMSVARLAGTIGYELLTGVPASLPRTYLSDEVARSAHLA
ncbi:MAG: alanine racemase [Alphaproteobacteria bacterium]